MLARREALYYPFHLCSRQTIERLLSDYAVVHFRDYMALQLTRMTGTTAYEDRMGHAFPELVQAGRIVQGYSVSGPLDAEMAQSIDRDLADPTWRAHFHDALVEDRRFQRGLFDLSHSMVLAGVRVPGPAALLTLLETRRAVAHASVTHVTSLLDRRLGLEAAYDCEYGLALVKTSAALRYTVRLTRQHGFIAVTDSPRHFALLQITLAREEINLDNRLSLAGEDHDKRAAPRPPWQVEGGKVE